MRTKETKNRFVRFYVTYLLILVGLAIVFLIYVGAVSKEYADAQPENTVRTEIDRLTEAAQSGTLGELIDFNKLCSSSYEDNDPAALRSEFEDKLLHGDITIESVKGGANDADKLFNVLSDGSLIGKATLSWTNSRTKLFFFSMADWKLDSFEAIPTGTVYDLDIFCPAGTKLLINGVEPAAEDMAQSEPVPEYVISGLLSEPSIEYSNNSGSVPYALKDGKVIPLLYSCRLQLPDSISVTLNGSPAPGEKNGSGLTLYDIREMVKPEMTLTDACGGSLDFNVTDSVTLYDYSVSVPENVTVTVNGVPADKVCTAQNVDNPDAAQLMKQAGVTLPDLKQYKFSLLSDNAEAVVSDGARSRSYTLGKQALILNGVSSTDDIPDDIAAQIDVLDVAEKWSKFMTADLSGAHYGLDTIRKYLIAGSDYYDYAAQWATGTDITFTSPHSIDGFTGESVSDFTQYSDTCFSCHVYFEKQMTLYSSGNFAGSRTDVFNSIMYFVYVDDTDNGVDDPHWAVAVMHDVV